MSFDWTLPDGVSVGKPQYPVPAPLLISGIMNYIYEGDYAVLVDVHIPEKLAVGSAIPISVYSEWLACTEEVCVPEKDSLSITLTVAEDEASIAPNPAFDKFRMALPKPLGSEATFSLSKDRFRLAVPYPADMPVQAPYFFIIEDGVIDYAAPQKISREGDTILIETATRGEEPKNIHGILKVGPDLGLALSANQGTLKDGAALFGALADDGTPLIQKGGGSLMLLAFAGAVLGGLLLNLMPCVFPILSLKAISIAKSGGETGKVRADALAYTAGVVAMATALGGLLLILRAGGASVGWAFQLQDPRIIFLLLALVSAIAFNLAGLFELPTLDFGGRLTAKEGPAGSFWTGILAAFIATPCTGPFMAAALGATIILPPLAALFIFAGLGIGLALPFLAIAYVPALRRLMPAPGPWLDGFRKLMAVPMFLTAIALLWLLNNQVSGNMLGLLMLLTFVMVAALWWFGMGQQKNRARGGLTMAALCAVLIIGFVMIPGSLLQKGEGEQAVLAGGMLQAEKFDEAKLTRLREDGKPVFAYFTADWCITCKANEAGALNRRETAKAFDAAKVNVMIGDWTNPDPVISRFLTRHGRAGVPLYIYYAPGEKPRILPQILTVSMLTDMVSG